MLSTLAKGLKVLTFIANSKKLVRLVDVADAMSLDKSAALRVLKTLEQEGFVIRHHAMKTYSVSPNWLPVGGKSDSVRRLIEVSKQFLVDLSTETGLYSHLGLLEGTKAILVEVAASSSKVVINQAVGDLEPLYCSAVGKAIYAHLPDQERTLINRGIDFEKYTPRTISSFSELDAEVARVREAGVAFDNMEINEDIGCIACPIFDEDGYPIASVGISIVASRLHKQVSMCTEEIERVRRAAADLQRTWLRQHAHKRVA